MAIRRFLSLDAPEEHFPVTHRLQQHLASALEDQVPDIDNFLTDMLALAVVGPESRVVQPEATIREVDTERMDLKTTSSTWRLGSLKRELD